MTVKTAYLFEVIEKIGAPLLSAAGQAPAVDSGRPEAAVLAELLALAVQAGVDLAGIMDVQERDGDGESVRLALAGLGGQMIVEHVRIHGAAPTAADLKKSVNALTTVLTFADNFNPAAGNSARLKALEAGTPPIDDTQVMMQSLQALTPLVFTISSYSFGRPERKLMQEVIDKLLRQAAALAQALMPQAALTDIKQTELVILRAMVPLYCEAHRRETQRIQDMDEAGRQQIINMNDGLVPLDPVWTTFDRHLGILRVLAQSIAGRFTAGSEPNSVAPATPPAAAPAPVSPPPAQAEPEPQQNYNPMAFFKPGNQQKEEDE